MDDIAYGHKAYIVQPYTVLNYDCKKKDGTYPKITLGKFSSVATNCTFVLAHHRTDTFTTSPGIGYSRGHIVIGNDVLIGANSTILDNVVLGDGCVVGAGSVVTKSVPPYAIVAGNPAKIIRYRFKKHIRRRLAKLDFWNLDNDVIQTFDLWTTDIEKMVGRIEQFKQCVWRHQDHVPPILVRRPL